MLNGPARVAIYARVSTEEQAEHGYSIDAQLDTLKNFCKMQQKVIVNEYVDRGVSGKSMEGRFELKRLLRDAKNGEFDEVIVWKINRLARKTIDLLKIVDTLNKHNVSFRSFSENFETQTPMGKFALQMMGAVGKLERNTIVDNVKMGMKQRARTGRWNGRAVLGYKSVDVAGREKKSKETRLEIVPDEAAIIRKIFELYASGKGLRAIANQLNHEGHKTKKGNPFSTIAIKDIITNPIFAGKIRYNRFENWNEKRRKCKNNEPIIVDGDHEAIISEALWEKVQMLQKSKSKIAPRTFDGQYTLTGLIRCPEYGAPMVANRTKNRLKDGTHVIRRYYSCSNFRNKGTAVCHANSVQADYAEKHVSDRIKKAILNPNILKDIVANINNWKVNKVKPLRNELKSIEKNLDRINTRQQKHLELYEDDAIDKEIFRTRLDELTAESDKLLSRKSEIAYELEDETTQQFSYEYVHSIISLFDDLLDSASPEQKKSLLHLIIKQISINEKRKIQNIELAFSENTQKHFLEFAPSDTNSEGAFALPKQKLSHQKFSIVI